MATATKGCCLLLAAVWSFSILSTSATALQLEAVRHLWQFPTTLVYKHSTLDEAISSPPVNALVLVVGVDKPSRRQGTQPLLTFSPQAAEQIPHAVQQLLLQCMQQLEQLGAAGSFGLQLDVLPNDFQQATTGPGPMLVFDASTGRVLLSQHMLRVLQSSRVHTLSTASRATSSAAQRMLLLLASQAGSSGLSMLLQLAPKAAAAGIMAAFVAVVPKWFCFVCPIVLGLLAPLVINAGVGEAAELACQALQLTDEECVDLWFTALGLGMILSLLSAIPIYKVCRLYECAHPGPNTTTAAVAVA